MSTDYEIRCVEPDCLSHGESFEQDGWRTPEPVQDLIDLRPELAAIDAKLGGVGTDFWLRGWDAYGSMFPALFHFMGRHKACALAVYDEYGRPWTPGVTTPAGSAGEVPRRDVPQRDPRTVSLTILDSIPEWNWEKPK